MVVMGKLNRICFTNCLGKKTKTNTHTLHSCIGPSPAKTHVVSETMHVLN